MSVSSPVYLTIVTRGATYKVCWSTEASQQVTVLQNNDIRAGVRHPVIHSEIIRAIRRSPADSIAIQAEIGSADLGIFLVENEGIAYEVLVSYYPATAVGGTNVCEIGGVSICKDPTLLAALKQRTIPVYSNTLQNGPVSKKELAPSTR